MPANFLLFLTMLVSALIGMAGNVAAGEKNYEEMLYKDVWTLAQYPAPGNYPVVGDQGKESSVLDIASHPLAKKYETVLSQGFKKPSDFAGHYVVIDTDCAGICSAPPVVKDNVVSHVYDGSMVGGCGTDTCRAYWIVDKHDGKIVAVTGVDHDVTYAVDSTLFVVNPYKDYLNKKYKDVPKQSALSFYTLKNNELELVSSVCCREDKKQN